MLEGKWTSPMKVASEGQARGAHVVPRRLWISAKQSHAWPEGHLGHCSEELKVQTGVLVVDKHCAGCSEQDELPSALTHPCTA